MDGWTDGHMQCVGKRVAMGYVLTEPETGCCSPRFHGLGRELLGILGSFCLPQELEATVLCSRDLPQQRGWTGALGLLCPVNPQATDGDSRGRFPQWELSHNVLEDHVCHCCLGCLQTPPVDEESTWHDSCYMAGEQTAGNPILIHAATQGLQTLHPLGALGGCMLC